MSNWLAKHGGAKGLLRHPMFWVLLIDLTIRVITQLGNSVSLIYSDSDTYVLYASGAQSAGAAPPGYPLFMQFLHAVWPSIEFLLAVQHAMVLLAGIAVYRAVRNLDGGRGIATVAAAIFLFSGQMLSTAQAILTESTFAVLMAYVAWALTRVLRHSRIRDAVLLGGLLGVAATVRAVGMPLLMFLTAGLFVGLLLFDRREALRVRWRAPLISGLVMVAAAVGGVAFVAVVGGTTAGLPVVGKSNVGWALYGRVAQFADCPATYVKPSLRDLCPKEPEDARQGPDYWRVFGGPALERFGSSENGNEELAEFSQAVIVHQPIDWLKASIVDMGRFFVPNFGRERGYSGAGLDELELDRTVGLKGAADHETVIETYYRNFSQRASNLQLVARYQEATTITPGWWSVMLLIAVPGMFLLRGRARLASILMIGSGLFLMFLATSLLQYVARYALPALPFMLIAAAISAQELARRVTRAAPESGLSGASSDAASLEDGADAASPEDGSDVEPDATTDAAAEPTASVKTASS